MTEQQNFIVANLLNGVPVEEVARAFGVGAGAALELFLDVMRTVEEYQVVHCMPHFGCRGLAEAVRSRMQVLQAIQAIERWDMIERPFMLDLLAKRGTARHGLAREEQLEIVQRAMMALAHYLPKAKLQEFERGRVKWTMAHPREALAAMERFVSLTEPHTLKNIRHVGADAGIDVMGLAVEACALIH